jgi:signal transduction histidine kinase
MATEQHSNRLGDAAARVEGQLRSRIFWTLCAFAVTPLAAMLVVSNDTWALLVGFLGFFVAIIAAFVGTNILLAPVYELERRLRVKNYGDDGATQMTTLAAPLSLDEGASEVAATLLDVWSRRARESLARWSGPLPSELAEIERLARSGRVSDLAMESVKKDLFRHLSHQLKSPMALLRAHSQAVRNRFESSDAQGAIEGLASIEEIAMSVSGLVEQLLSMAWVEGLEERGLGRSKANLSTALMQVMRFRQLIASERAIKLESQVDAGMWVVGEQQLLQEMFASLVDNAIRYSPKGSVVRLEGRLVPNTRAIVVTVTDQGPGIPRAERERVFEPFYGAVGTDEAGNINYGTRRHRVLAEGLVRSSHGLGLALVRSVARLHGADVTLDDGPAGKGLCARVTLGASSAPAEKPPAPPEA